MIIGLCGLIGSGKGTVSEHLMRKHDFIGVSFAEALKDAAACIFGWDRDMLEGSLNDSRYVREQPDEWWSERLGFETSPRSMLQFMGTEVMRNNLHPEIWVLATENRMFNMEKMFFELNVGKKPDFVISDVRFPNEIAMIRRNGGKIWHVQRGPLPEWFGKDDLSIHESERAWNNEPMDATIYNNGTIEQMCGTADVLLDNDIKS
jgi:hypothetical protein